MDFGACCLASGFVFGGRQRFPPSRVVSWAVTLRAERETAAAFLSRCFLFAVVGSAFPHRHPRTDNAAKEGRRTSQQRDGGAGEADVLA